MKSYRQTIVAIVEPLYYITDQIPYGMQRSYRIPIACETRRVRIGSAIAATLLADPFIAENRDDIVAFKVTVNGVTYAIDSIGSWRMGVAA